MYRVQIRPRAEKDIAALPVSTARRILAILAALGDNPRPLGIRKLRGTDGYRLRWGDYRIILEIDDNAQQVVIVRVRHRREVYRGI